MRQLSIDDEPGAHVKSGRIGGLDGACERWPSSPSWRITSGRIACPAGFLGVDLFMVLSGFLITGLLVDERSRTGAVRLGAFWARRFRRLVPALLAVLVGVAVWVRITGPATLSSRRFADRGSPRCSTSATGGSSATAPATPHRATRRRRSCTCGHCRSRNSSMIWPVVVGAVLATTSGSPSPAAQHPRCTRIRTRDGGMVRAGNGPSTPLLRDRHPSAGVPDRRGGSARGPARPRRNQPAILEVSVCRPSLSSSWLSPWATRQPALPRRVRRVCGCGCHHHHRRRRSQLPLAPARPRAVAGDRPFPCWIYLWHWPVLVFVTSDTVPFTGIGLVAVPAGLISVATAISWFAIEFPYRRANRRVAVPLAVGGIALAFICLYDAAEPVGCSRTPTSMCPRSGRRSSSLPRQSRRPPRPSSRSSRRNRDDRRRLQHVRRHAGGPRASRARCESCRRRLPARDSRGPPASVGQERRRVSA